MTRTRSTPATTTSTSRRCHRSVWESRLPRELAERGPRVVDEGKGRQWVCEGRVIGRSGMPKNKELVKKLSAIGRAGIDDDGYRAGTPKLRLEDMDRDGLAASVVYGPLSLGFPIDDPELQDATYAAWNDWAAEEFNAVAPDRLCALAFLPFHSPEAAAAELERCAAIGHRGAIVDAFRVDLGDPAWDRLWAAAEQHRAPDQLPHQRRHLAEAQLPDRQVAVGGVRDAAADAARRAARDDGVLGRARAAPGPAARARGVGHRLAPVLPHPHGRASGTSCGTKLDYAPTVAAERARPAPGDPDVRAGAARRAVHPA